MPVPWAQIVRLMPSILELSHELLRRTRRATPPGEEPVRNDEGPSAATVLEARVAALEENERRQAELVTNMADQLEQLTTALTALHRQWRTVVGSLIVVGVVGVVALGIAVRASLAH